MKRFVIAAMFTACLLSPLACDSPAEPDALPAPPTPTKFIEITAGGDHSCAIRADNRAFCWGSARGGRLGDGRLDPVASIVPTPVSGGALFFRVRAGYQHTCAIAPGGVPYCWGVAENGQVANRSSVPQTRPFRIVENPFQFLDVTAGERHSCGIDPQSRAYCWGWNFFGQIGNSSTIDQGVPVSVHLDAQVRQISAGRNHTCSITASGVAHCWGAGSSGELGDGGSVNRTLAVKVAGNEVWAAISAGGSHTCALTTTGIAWCWGNGTAGQLGNAGLQNSAVPAKVAGDFRFTKISAGDEHSCAVTQEGAIHCWGHNNYGRLGSVSLPAPIPTPTPVTSTVPFLEVSAGRLHTCALARDGGVYCWGFGGFGQLGSGALFAQSVPARVAEPDSTPPVVSIRQ